MSRYYSLYDRRRMTDWLNDPKRVKGCSRKQIEYLRELKSFLPEFARIGTLTYFLLAKVGIQDVRTMMTSAKKQKNLILAVIKDLKLYLVNPEDEKVFEEDIKGIRKRIDHVFFICQEDLRLTEHYPYFRQIGFDKLTNFETAWHDNGETVLDWLLPEMEMWEASHQEEIREHMKSVAEEIETREKHKAEVKAKEKAEKEAQKAKAKAEKAEQKEIEKIRRREEIRERLIEKEIQTTLRRVGVWE